ATPGTTCPSRAEYRPGRFQISPGFCSTPHLLPENAAVVVQSTGSGPNPALRWPRIPRPLGFALCFHKPSRRLSVATGLAPFETYRKDSRAEAKNIHGKCARDTNARKRRA